MDQFFAGQEAQHLGAAHGFAGNVNALREYVDDSLLGERVERLLTATALRERDLVHWAPTVRSPPEAIRAQWCHGAPGIVAVLGDLMPLQLAEAAGELTWRAGPLRKGAGLCHGTAGNGYFQLQLLALTGDERWLVRARVFAMYALAHLAAKRKQAGRAATPYGLATSASRSTQAIACVARRHCRRSMTSARVARPSRV